MHLMLRTHEQYPHLQTMPALLQYCLHRLQFHQNHQYLYALDYSEEPYQIYELPRELFFQSIKPN